MTRSCSPCVDGPPVTMTIKVASGKRGRSAQPCVCGAQRQTGLAHGDGSPDGLMGGVLGAAGNLYCDWLGVHGVVCLYRLIICGVSFPPSVLHSISENCQEAFNLDKGSQPTGMEDAHRHVFD